MSFDFNVSLSGTTASIIYTFTNNLSENVYVMSFWALGDLSLDSLEDENNKLTVNFVEPGESIQRTFTKTVAPGNTYSYMYTAYTASGNFSFWNESYESDVWIRRPLSPPGKLVVVDPVSFNDTFLASSLRVGTSYTLDMTASNATSMTTNSALPSGMAQSQTNISGGKRFILSGAVNYSALGGQSSKSYTILVTASNSTDSKNASDSFTVFDGLPNISGSLSNNMRVGESYSGSLSKNIYARNISSSGTVLQNGLSFSNSTLALSGTPVSSGNYTFSATGTNDSGNSDTYNITFNILPRLPVWTDQNISTNFVIDEPYSDSISANYADAYEVTSGALPDGISLNPSTGALTGTPTTPGGYSFILSARNSANEYINTQQFVVSIEESGGNLFTYNGSSWTENEVYAYINGSWTRGRVYVYDGNEWVKSEQL